jgi:hypothetical protein
MRYCYYLQDQEANGEKFFTAAEPADYLKPGISGPVSRDDMLRSVELDGWKMVRFGNRVNREGTMEQGTMIYFT